MIQLRNYKTGVAKKAYLGLRTTNQMNKREPSSSAEGKQRSKLNQKEEDRTTSSKGEQVQTRGRLTRDGSRNEGLVVVEARTLLTVRLPLARSTGASAETSDTYDRATEGANGGVSTGSRVASATRSNEQSVDVRLTSATDLSVCQ
jgi:hypothetical protein